MYYYGVHYYGTGLVTEATGFEESEAVIDGEADVGIGRFAFAI